MKRILIVEDDEFIRDLVSAKLRQASYEIETCSSGEDALSKIAESDINLIILDLELTGLQGVDVLRLLSESGDLSKTPVIVFSNKDEAEAKEECRKLGATAFYVKVNTDLDELLTCVNEAVSNN